MTKSRYYFYQSFRILLFIASFLGLWLLSNQTFSQLGKWWSIICTVINLATISTLLLYGKKNGMSYSEIIRYQPKTTRAKTKILGIVVVMVVGMGGMFLAGLLVYRQFPYLAKNLIEPIPYGLAALNILLLPITTTLAEDGLYLGIGVNQSPKGKLAFIIPALFYALQHSFIPLYFDFSYVIYRFLSFLPLTIILCYWYFKKRNPVPIVLGHFVINLATVLQIFIVSMWPILYESM